MNETGRDFSPDWLFVLNAWAIDPLLERGSLKRLKTGVG
jgi:hypothetical protein